MRIRKRACPNFWTDLILHDVGALTFADSLAGAGGLTKPPNYSAWHEFLPTCFRSSYLHEPSFI